MDLKFKNWAFELGYVAQDHENAHERLEVSLELKKKGC
jgi:hypothetical protein